MNNVRTQAIQEIRQDWKKDSRFVFGKNRVCQVALGRTEAEEHAENLHLLSARLKGQCGLLFTNRPREQVQHFFDTYSLDDHARSGTIATRDVEVCTTNIELMYGD